LHGRAARYYGDFGVILGAFGGSTVIIMTWYGINFILKSGRHAYGSGNSNAPTIFLLVFITVHLLWGSFVILRMIWQRCFADTDTAG